MKMDERALVEILEIVRSGFAYGTDVSEKLRDMDLESDGAGKLKLTEQYLKAQSALD